MEVKKIYQKTIVDQVMEKMKELIVSGKYKPGDRLPTEQELADTFGIGRSSIREAVKIFNYLGVLESKAAKGTFLSERAQISTEALSWSILLGKDEMGDLIDTRGALELWSIITLTDRYRVSPEIYEPWIRELEVELDNIRKGASLGSRDILQAADYNFHYIIIKSTGNEIFKSIYKTLKSFLFEEINLSQKAYVDPSSIVRDHLAILEAIKTGDVNRAMRTFNDHIQTTLLLIEKGSGV